MNDRTAPADHPLLPAIAARWSPRSYRADPVTESELMSVLEAGRWSSSAYNEQPWAFILGQKGTPGHEAILGCLVPFNQGWAVAAPVLIMACYRANNAKGEPNPWAQHDTGQACAAMAIQAAALGLQLHQMAGFDTAAARDKLGLPAGVEPIAAMALGRPGPASALNEQLAARETAPRQRKPMNDFVFSGRHGAPFR
jgi:nitroreductase